MAHRRMFSADICSSDAYLDMPVSARDLYFQLSLNADDDGFVNPKRIVRITGASDDDLKVLVAKRFLLPFETGVVVIKHWLVHNLIRADLYKETMYTEEKSLIGLKRNGAYSELKNDRPDVHGLKSIEAPKWLKIRRKSTYRKRTADVPQTALRLGKVRLGKVSKQIQAPQAVQEDPVNELIGAFKEVNPMISRHFANTTQRQSIKNLLKEMTKEQLLAVIKFLPKSNTSPYAPTITTPYQLESKFAQLKAWADRKKEETVPNVVKIS